ncbi:MAG: endolytic transglycosylase MltG [Inconstantimicrobium porci]|uniref:endolytic transglycosylase MltG n=1 Tax=Inconstantimicrobium porci TaxID=2652291 RepID=UPI002409D2FC|nr:endolytic transglycosylase MltG [Inconstantimicrobium porci]MDD6770269.1 endolytic transglycosylase MltG [Inconstantimicrobium porci]MDY5913174.1 endolytic transglycosylase MltG [Inconstantimicrobium porci]
MKKLKSYVLIAILICVVISAAVSYNIYNKTITNPLVNSSSDLEIKVTDGDTLYSVFEELYNQKKLRSLNFTKIYIKTHNISDNIKKGTYEFEKGVSLDELIKELQTGETNRIKLTIPEGYTITDIASKVEKSGLATKDDFLKAVKNYSPPGYVKEDPKKRYNLEGYLFPDTYYFSKKTDSNTIIKTMIDRTEEVFKQISKKTGDNINEANYEDILTKASVIEKEARSDKDRYLISSVIDNRINKKMKLQIDATVIYAYGYHKEKLYNKDLIIDSPYNTYKYTGLPIGPICNPGMESIIASLKPEKTDYIYYVWTGKGKDHFFTNDYKQFLSEKRKANL